MTRPIARALAVFLPVLLPVSVPVLASLTGCTPTPTILPTNDLNRPTDIAFMCLGTSEVTAPDGTPTGTFDVSGRPMSVCHPPPVADTKAEQPAVSMQNRTFAFVPNSASGDLSVIDADSWKIVDLNRATGGYGRVPLGTLPEQISTTTDGCRLVSANRGSCDLSLVDPSTLLAPVFAAQYNNAGEGVLVNVPPANGIQTVVPVLGDGSTPLGAAPYEAVFLPQDISQINACPANGAPSTASWRALVTFPSCNLIAIVELPSGKIVSSARGVATKDANGQDQIAFEDAGTSPICRSECEDGRGAAAPDGGGDPDAGSGPVTDGTAPRPTGIAITPQADRAYISFANVAAILPLSLSSGALAGTGPATGIALHEGAQGSNRIRLGVDPYSFKTSPQSFPGRFVGDNKDRAYLYVIARDGSLRIIDVFNPGFETECETNFDALDPQLPPPGPGQPRPMVAVDAGQRCIPYGSVKRRPYSRDAAGLRFPTFPVDVAAADMARGTGGDHREDTVAGGYAWVLTANGQIFLVNIDPVERSIKAVVHQDQKVLFDPDPASAATYADQAFVYKNDPTMEPLGVKEPPPFPNRPRDRNFLSYSASLDPTLGLVRVDIPPIAVTGPYIEPLWTQGTEDNATAVDIKPRQTYVFFPDRDGAVAQGWDVVWQGTIVSPRYSGVLRGNVLRDGGGRFCELGVQAGDIVTLNGCTVDTQCPLGMTCQRDSTVDLVSGGLTVTGICISANLQRTIDARCQPYVSSLRRYEITKASQGELTLAPHLDELVRSSLSSCRLTGAAGAAGTTGAAGMGGAGGAAGTGGAGGAGGMGGGGGTGGAGGSGGGMSGAGGAGGTGGIKDDPTQDCRDPIDSSTNNFKCVDLAGQRRCLDPCTKQQECRNGRVCLRTCEQDADCPSKACNVKDGMCLTGQACNGTTLVCPDGETCNVDGQCERDSYCADGPPLVGNDFCFPQLTGYQVNVGAGFMVTGTQAGSFAYGIEVGGQCAPDPQRDPRLVSRIPVRPAPGQPESSILCDSQTTRVFPTLQTVKATDNAMTDMMGKVVADDAGDGYHIDRFDSRITPIGGVPGYFDKRQVPAGVITEESAQLVDWMKKWTADVSAPNACIYKAGPIQGDPVNDPKELDERDSRPQHVRARFRNTQIAFVLANVDRGPPGASTIHFEVHGGFRPQFVVMPTTVEISAPARLVLGPVDSNQKVEVTPGPAPFFFVVDQRRLGRGQGGGPTRGQIVRVSPFGLQANGYLPIYEDYGRSGNLFPIQ